MQFFTFNNLKSQCFLCMTVTPLFLEKSHMTLSFLLSPPLSLAEDSLQSDQRLLLPRLPPNIH